METNQLWAGVSAGILSLALTGPLAAQTSQQNQGQQDQPKSQMQQDQQPQAQAKDSQGAQAGVRQGLKASELIGYTVQNMQGEKLGTVNDVVLNTAGQVSYLAIEPAKDVQADNKMLAIPWHAFRGAAREQQVLLLPASKEQLAQAPGFESDRWLGAGDPESQALLDRFYVVLVAPMLREVSFSDIDQDSDGNISRQEAQRAEVLANHFRAVDENNDGAISKSEFSAFETQIEQIQGGGQPGGMQQGDQQQRQPGRSPQEESGGQTK